MTMFPGCCLYCHWVVIKHDGAGKEKGANIEEKPPSSRNSVESNRGSAAEASNEGLKPSISRGGKSSGIQHPASELLVCINPSPLERNIKVEPATGDQSSAPGDALTAAGLNLRLRVARLTEASDERHGDAAALTASRPPALISPPLNRENLSRRLASGSFCCRRGNFSCSLGLMSVLCR